MDTAIKVESGGIVWLGIKLLLLRINPFISVQSYNRRLGVMIDGMSMGAVRQYRYELIGAIQFSKKVSKCYRNSKEETNKWIMLFPKLGEFQSILQGVVKAQREKYHLNI